MKRDSLLGAMETFFHGFFDILGERDPDVHNALIRTKLTAWFMPLPVFHSITEPGVKEVVFDVEVREGNWIYRAEARVPIAVPPVPVTAGYQDRLLTPAEKLTPSRAVQAWITFGIVVGNERLSLDLRSRLYSDGDTHHHVIKRRETALQSRLVVMDAVLRVQNEPAIRVYWDWTRANIGFEYERPRHRLTADQLRHLWSLWQPRHPTLAKFREFAMDVVCDYYDSFVFGDSNSDHE